MRFLVDANMSPRVAELLRSKGYDAVAVREIGLVDAADDEILDRAATDARIVVSHDTDFGTLLAFQRRSKPSVCVAALTELGRGRPATQTAHPASRQ